MAGVKLSDRTQAEMDQSFGVRSAQIIVPGEGSAKSRRDLVYSQALVAARAAFPGDGVAAHRAAMRMANRAAITQPGRTPNEEERKTIDAALLAAFPEDTADRGRLSIEKEFPDYIIARGADGELYKITFTVGLGGKSFTFGTPEEIEDGPEDEPEGSGEPQGK